jgi:hypothetical protein
MRGVDNHTPQKGLISKKFLKIPARRKHIKRPGKIKDLRVGEFGMCCPYIDVGHFQRGLGE